MSRVVVISILFMSFSVYAQFSESEQWKIDSLASNINNFESHDTTKVNSLIDLAWIYYLEYPDTAMKFCLEAKTTSERIKYWHGISISNHWLGYLKTNKFEYFEALEHYFKSLEARKKIGEKDEIANTLNEIGSIFGRQGDMINALKYHNESLLIREQLGDDKGIGYSLNNLGIIYKQQGDIPKAIEYYKKAIEKYRLVNFVMGITYGLNNIAVALKNQGQVEEAIEKYRECLSLYREIKDVEGEALVLNNIAGAFKVRDNLDSCLYYYEKSLIIFRDRKNLRRISGVLSNMASIAILKGDFNKAQNYSTEALALAQSAKSPEEISSSAEILSKVAKHKKNFNTALKMFELHIQMRDSLKNQETQKATIRQQTKYEFEKEQLIKEQKLKEENRKLKAETERRDNIQYSVIFIAILAVFGTILSLGFIKVSPKFAEGLIFFAFLIFFEFCLVLLDPYVDKYSGGEPAYKLLFNALLAGVIFPIHAFFENKLKITISKT